MEVQQNLAPADSICSPLDQGAADPGDRLQVPRIPGLDGHGRHALQRLLLTAAAAARLLSGAEPELEARGDEPSGLHAARRPAAAAAAVGRGSHCVERKVERRPELRHGLARRQVVHDLSPVL